jgi:hypothetical protein
MGNGGTDKHILEEYDQLHAPPALFLGKELPALIG